MLNRTLTLRFLLRTAGLLLLLWALDSAIRVATEPIGETFANGTTDTRLQIQISLTDTLFSMVYFGEVLFFVAAGLLLLGLSSRHVSIAYLSIQGALWLAGISVWYRSNSTFNPYPLDAFWIIVTLICSLALLALYKPLVSLLGKLMLQTERGNAALE